MTFRTKKTTTTRVFCLFESLASCSYEGWSTVFYMLLFLSFSLSFCPFIAFSILSSLCAICVPSVYPVMPQMALVKDAEDHRGFLSKWPQCALHLPLTAWSITHKCFLLLFGSRLSAHGPACLSKPLSSLLWASVGNKPTYLHFLWTMFSVTVSKTPLNLKACILLDIVIQGPCYQVQVIHDALTTV